MQSIGGYVVVTHLVSNGYHDHIVTHAFGDLPAAERHVAGRITKIDRKSGHYADDDTNFLNHEDYPTLHAVSPRIFAKVQDHLSRGHDYESFALRLGTAIARHTEESERLRVKYPYTYKVGETEVLGTKSEWLAHGNRDEVEGAAKRSAGGLYRGGLISRFER